MSASRTLLFDLDGTLSDNFLGISRSIRYALSRVGAPDVEEHALRACMGPPLRASLGKLLATSDPAMVERALGHYRERYAVEGWRENRLYEGIEIALATLAANGCSMFVCTSKPKTHAEKIVAHFGVAAHFDAVYGPDLGGRFDDKSELMKALIAAERLDARNCVMIGDREQDIHAARAHGVPTVGVLWGYGTRKELLGAGADSLVDCPEALPAAIVGLRRIRQA